jgi:exodeoxyribonuclease VIII
MKEGVYKDMDIDEYHSNPSIVSSTGLKKVKKSTRDFVHYVINGEKPKSCFDFGNAFEIALMDMVNGTNMFDRDVAVMPTLEWTGIALDDNPNLKVPASSKIYRELKQEFERQNFGKYILTDVGASESKEALDDMVKSCASNVTVHKLLSGTTYQVSLFWRDQDTGVMCKTRPDICLNKKRVLVDIKTCKDASPHGFARDAANLDYPIQAAIQARGATESGLMESVDNYFWLAVEKTPPYNLGLYEFQQDDAEYFSDVLDHYLERCAKAIKSISEMKDNDLSQIASYGENAQNRFGIIPLDIPLWYRGIN